MKRLSAAFKRKTLPPSLVAGAPRSGSEDPDSGSEKAGPAAVSPEILVPGTALGAGLPIVPGSDTPTVLSDAVPPKLEPTILSDPAATVLSDPAATVVGGPSTLLGAGGATI